MDRVAHGNARTSGSEGILDHVKGAIRDTNRKLSRRSLHGDFKVFTWRCGQFGNVARSRFETLLHEASV
jgi:hypothetical protein